MWIRNDSYESLTKNGDSMKNYSNNFGYLGALLSSTIFSYVGFAAYYLVLSSFYFGMILFFLSKYDVKDFKITFEKIKKMVKKVHLNDIALAIVFSIPFTITRTENMK